MPGRCLVLAVLPQHHPICGRQPSGQAQLAGEVTAAPLRFPAREDLVLSSGFSTPTATFPGSVTGASKLMFQLCPAASGSRPSRMRAAEYIPWTMAEGMPSTFALTPERWMGL